MCMCVSLLFVHAHEIAAILNLLQLCWWWWRQRRRRWCCCCAYRFCFSLSRARFRLFGRCKLDTVEAFSVVFSPAFTIRAFAFIFVRYHTHYGSVDVAIAVFSWTTVRLMHEDRFFSPCLCCCCFSLSIKSTVFYASGFEPNELKLSIIGVGIITIHVQKTSPRTHTHTHTHEPSLTHSQAVYSKCIRMPFNYEIFQINCSLLYFEHSFVFFSLRFHTLSLSLSLSLSLICLSSFCVCALVKWIYMIFVYPLLWTFQYLMFVEWRASYDERFKPAKQK